MFRYRPKASPPSARSVTESLLSTRLKLARSLIPDDWNHCDVATGHGQLLAELARSSSNRLLWGTDRASSEIAAAKRLFDSLGVSKQIVLNEFEHLPRVSAVDSPRPWSLSITGLGGRSMASILLSDPVATLQFARMILQPNRDEDLVRQALHVLGYAPEAERLVYDRRYVYLVLDCSAIGLANPPQTRAEIACGREFTGDDAHLKSAYYSWRIGYHEERLRGAQFRHDSEATEAAHRALRYLRDKL